MDYANIIFTIVFGGIGYLIFDSGLRKIRLKFLVNNLKTSMISGLKPGLAEIKGVIAADKDRITAPFSRLEGVLCRWHLEYHSASYSFRDRVYDSCDGRYFKVDDGTGTILIDSLYADWDTKMTYENGVTEKSRDILKKYDISKLYPVNDKMVSATEWLLKEGDSIYILGNVVIKNKGLLFISDKDEKHIIAGLNWTIWVRIFIGLGLIALGIMIFLKAS